MQEILAPSNDLQIACFITNPDEKETIFFIHGNSSSSRVWRKQVVSPLLNNYRLVTIDLPSHGKSAALPADADFSLPAIAKTVAMTVSQILNDKPFIICGSSLGTNIVAEMVASDLAPAGLLLAGPCVVGEGYSMDKMILSGADVSAVFQENVPEESVKKYAAETSISKDETDIDFFLEDYNQVKGSFRSFLFATITSGLFSDEIDILKKNNCPVCIVFGEDEKVVNNYYLDGVPINLWNNIIYKIPAASHLVNIDAPEEFNTLLAHFAKDIFTKDVA